MDIMSLQHALGVKITVILNVNKKSFDRGLSSKVQ